MNKINWLVMLRSIVAEINGRNFIKARNKFNSDIKKAENNYMIEVLGRNAQTQNKFWTSITGILPVKSHNTASKVVDPVTNRLCTETDAVNVINCFFANIVRTLSDGLPSIQKPYSLSKFNSKINKLRPLSNY